ncbi:MAG: hypothetical protein LRY66_09365 [Saccharospirillaceae bacterium]|nr:hypothetical protein [Saccharospirillaceae bacterium]MCD8531552.1 hypothetical protein [Saccharospirillaceae bacterium]
MNFLEVATAVGLGTILAKLIDVYLLQSIISKRSLNLWLREKKYAVYCELSSNLLSFGLNKKNETNPFLNLAEIGPAVLLTDDEALLEKLYEFVNKRDYMFRLQDGLESEKVHYPNYSSDPKILYSELVDDSKSIVYDLRKHLRNNDA